MGAEEDRPKQERVTADAAPAGDKYPPPPQKSAQHP